jgi:hypothetical protein
MHALHINPFKQSMDTRRRHQYRRRPRRTPRRHRRERAGLQPLQAQPEATVLPHQHLQPRPITAEKDEAITTERILSQLPLHHTRQQVDPPSHILRLPRHENPADGSEGQHDRSRHASTTASNRTAKSAGMPSVNVQRTPLRVVMVRRRGRRRRGREGRTTISTNPVGMPTAYRDQMGEMGERRTDTVATINPAFGLDDTIMTNETI